MINLYENRWVDWEATITKMQSSRNLFVVLKAKDDLLFVSAASLKFLPFSKFLALQMLFNRFLRAFIILALFIT